MVFGFLKGLFGGSEPTIEVQKAAVGGGLPIVYGTRKLDAKPVFKEVSQNNLPSNPSLDKWDYERANPETSDDDEFRDHQDFLYVVSAFCQGPISALNDFRVDGVKHTSRKFNSEDDPYVRLTSYYGHKAQGPYRSLTSINAGWNLNCRGAGVAYAVARFYHSDDRPLFKNEPKLEAIVQGSPVYDPRKDIALGGTHDLADDTSWDYSANRALVILAYLMSENGGRISPDYIDLDSFKEAADYCDEPIETPLAPVAETAVDFWLPHEGETRHYELGDSIEHVRITQLEEALSTADQHARHFVGAALDPKEPVVKNLKTLLEGALFSLMFSGGKYRLSFEDKGRTPVYFLNQSNVVSAPKIVRGGREKRYNQVTVEFPNADLQYEKDSVIWPKEDSPEHISMLEEDKFEILHSSVKAETITDVYRATRWAEILVRRSRLDRDIKGLKCTGRACLLEPGDLVQIDLPNHGLPNKLMLVDKVTVGEDMSALLDLMPYDETIYDSSELDQVDAIAMDEPPQIGALPSPIDTLSAVSFHEYKADGSALSGFQLSWAKPQSDFAVRSYYLSIYPVSDPANSRNYVFKGDVHSVVVSGLPDAENFKVEIRYDTNFGHSSEITSIDATLQQADTDIVDTASLYNGHFGYRGTSDTDVLGWILPTGARRIRKAISQYGDLVERGQAGILFAPQDDASIEEIFVAGQSLGGQILRSADEFSIAQDEAIAINVHARAEEIVTGARVWAGIECLDASGNVVDYLLTEKNRNPIEGDDLLQSGRRRARGVYGFPQGVASARAIVLVENLIAGHLAVSLVTSTITDQPADNLDPTQQPGGPTEAGADVTGQNTAHDTDNVGGTPSEVIIADLEAGVSFLEDQISPQDIQDGSISITEADTEPTSPDIGDYWFDTSGTTKLLYRYKSTGWQSRNSAAYVQSVQAILAAQTSADGKVTGFVNASDNAPVNPQEGDFWVPSDLDETRIYMGGAWVVSGDVTGQQTANDTANVSGVPASTLVADISSAAEFLEDQINPQDVRDGLIEITEALTAPSSPDIGDFWLDTSKTPLELNRYTSAGWRPRNKPEAIQAVQSILAAQTSADGKVTGYANASGDAPANPQQGDFWVPSDLNETRIYTDGAWLVSGDVTGQQTANDTANVSGVPAADVVADISNAVEFLEDQINPQDVRDGLIEITEAASAPSSPDIGDFWMDTSKTPLELNRYTSAGWKPRNKPEAIQSVQAILAAQTSADGKVTLFTEASSSPPSNPQNGDIWVPSDVTPRVVYVYQTSESQWLISSTEGATAGRNLTSDAGEILNTSDVFTADGLIAADLSWSFTRGNHDWHYPAVGGYPQSGAERKIIFFSGESDGRRSQLESRSGLQVDGYANPIVGIRMAVVEHPTGGGSFDFPFKPRLYYRKNGEANFNRYFEPINSIPGPDRMTTLKFDCERDDLHFGGENEWGRDEEVDQITLNVPDLWPFYYEVEDIAIGNIAIAKVDYDPRNVVDLRTGGGWDDTNGWSGDSTFVQIILASYTDKSFPFRARDRFSVACEQSITGKTYRTLRVAFKLGSTTVRIIDQSDERNRDEDVNIFQGIKVPNEEFDTVFIIALRKEMEGASASDTVTLTNLVINKGELAATGLMSQ